MHARTPIIDSDVYGQISGALEHLLGPPVVGGDDVDPEKGTRERGAAPALADLRHGQPGRRRAEADVGVAVRGCVVAEDLDEDLHGQARYQRACVLPLAKLLHSGLRLGQLLI